MKYSTHTVIERPADEVFAYLSDFENQRQWVRGVVTIRPGESVGDGGPAFELLAREGPWTVTCRVEQVDRNDADLCVTFRYSMAGWNTIDSMYCCAPAGDEATRVTLTIDSHLPALLRPLTPVFLLIARLSRPGCCFTMLCRVLEHQP